jgi:hypothetical protein
MFRAKRRVFWSPTSLPLHWVRAGESQMNPLGAGEKMSARCKAEFLMFEQRTEKLRPRAQFGGLGTQGLPKTESGCSS